MHRDLNLKKGDLVVLLQRIDENWFIGEMSGQQGYLPENFVEVKDWCT
jgi:E3 ubiquitin-protein ligase SH3RF